LTSHFVAHPGQNFQILFQNGNFTSEQNTFLCVGGASLIFGPFLDIFMLHISLAKINKSLIGLENVFPDRHYFLPLLNRVARFFLGHDTKTGKMHQINTKCT
jgi:hypothetical protein